MFSRSQTTAEVASSEGDTPVFPENSGGEVARAFDQVLTELQPTGPPSAGPDAASVSAGVTEHAATLRATRDAHQEAQSLLAVANEARRAASEEAERIVLEARDAAERTRQEIAGWAAAQRAKVDALAADLSESAQRDAEAVRAEALRTSMAEAEETARAYLAEAAAQAEEQADAIKDQARHVLHRATELGAEVAETIIDLTTTVTDIVDRLLDARSAMQQLLSEHAPAEIEDQGAPELDEPDSPSDLEDDSASERVVELDEFGEPIESLDPSAEDVEYVEDPEDPVGSMGSDDSGLDLVVGDRPPSPSAAMEQMDRQLGSMFRRHGYRGE
ncbi:ATP synthase F0 subunit B [Nocardioides stalactiti]|uniref:ATP synthase F0 subunit B n=1 Tax=Nocardioides stalactiti TaxID=2755356 RepID=UPI001600DFF1|nr:ATP synthase F0 subunit B [Nocardioides stalactiti]